ncbi:hypothetical protein FHR91_001643 [Erythrobacter lutimaris]|nr:hypothetical protein [Alteriqipengyuania lutimaris]
MNGRIVGIEQRIGHGRFSSDRIADYHPSFSALNLERVPP